MVTLNSGTKSNILTTDSVSFDTLRSFLNTRNSYNLRLKLIPNTRLVNFLKNVRSRGKRGSNCTALLLRFYKNRKFNKINYVEGEPQGTTKLLISFIHSLLHHLSSQSSCILTRKLSGINIITRNLSPIAH